MNFWLIGLISLVLSLLRLQREKCVKEGRPFFSLGRRRKRKLRPKPNPNRRIPDEASDYSMQQLNVLTHDPATSRRLIQNVKAKYPNKAMEWCAQRAIWEIERDRK